MGLGSVHSVTGRCPLVLVKQSIDMSEQTYRTIGALLGLALGIALMLVLGLRGIAFSALFGAGGCVAGAITAERIYASNRRQDR